MFVKVLSIVRREGLEKKVENSTKRLTPFPLISKNKQKLIYMPQTNSVRYGSYAIN